MLNIIIIIINAVQYTGLWPTPLHFFDPSSRRIIPQVIVTCVLAVLVILFQSLLLLHIILQIIKFIVFISSFISSHHSFLGLPLSLLPTGVQVVICLIISVGGRIKMCPNHSSRSALICMIIFSSPNSSSSSLFNLSHLSPSTVMFGLNIDLNISLSKIFRFSSSFLFITVVSIAYLTSGLTGVLYMQVLVSLLIFLF